MAELAEGLGLDLADPLAGHPQLLADLGEGVQAVSFEAETQLDHPPLAGRERVQHALDLEAQHHERGRRVHVRRVFVLDEVGQQAVLLLADRRLERDRLGQDPDDLADAVDRDLHRGADLLRRRLAAELLLEAGRDADVLVDRLDHVDGDPDRPGVIGQRAADRLADPPGGVGAELEAAAVVELLDRPHQPHVPFLDQVAQRDAAVHVAAGHADDQAEIGLHQPPAGDLPLEHSRLERPKLGRAVLAGRVQLAGGDGTRLDRLGQLDFGRRRQQRHPSDLVEVEGEGLADSLGLASAGILSGDDIFRRHHRGHAPSAPACASADVQA